MKLALSSTLARLAVSHGFGRRRGAAPNHAPPPQASDAEARGIAARVRFIVLEHASTGAFTPAGERPRLTQSA